MKCGDGTMPVSRFTLFSEPCLTTRVDDREDLEALMDEAMALVDP